MPTGKWQRRAVRSPARCPACPPTSGSAKGFRNIYFGSGAPGSSLGANGDVYINIG